MDLLIIALVIGVAAWFVSQNAVWTALTWVENEHVGGLRRLWSRICMLITVIALTWCVVMALCFIMLPTNFMDIGQLMDYTNENSWVFLLSFGLRAYYKFTYVGDWATGYRNHVVRLDPALSCSFIAAYDSYHAITTWKAAAKKTLDDFFGTKDFWWTVAMVLMALSSVGTLPLMVTFINRYAALQPLRKPVLAGDTTEE